MDQNFNRNQFRKCYNLLKLLFDKEIDQFLFCHLGIQPRLPSNDLTLAEPQNFFQTSIFDST